MSGNPNLTKLQRLHQWKPTSPANKQANNTDEENEAQLDEHEPAVPQTRPRKLNGQELRELEKQIMDMDDEFEPHTLADSDFGNDAEDEPRTPVKAPAKPNARAPAANAKKQTKPNTKEKHDDDDAGDEAHSEQANTTKPVTEKTTTKPAAAAKPGAAKKTKRDEAAPNGVQANGKQASTTQPPAKRTKTAASAATTTTTAPPSVDTRRPTATTSMTNDAITALQQEVELLKRQIRTLTDVPDMLKSLVMDVYRLQHSITLH